jgi:uncharacterized protein YjbI with pentapeptide repeats
MYVLELCRIALALLVLSSAPFVVLAQARWTWTDHDGKTRNKSDLDKILYAHKVWLESGGAIGKRADLSGALLAAGEMRGFELGSRSMEVTFDAQAEEESNLEHRDLRRADMSEANLSFVHMNHSRFAGAQLDNAKLAFTKLSNADFSGANLSGAFLHMADLTDANFDSAELKGADFTFSDVSGLRFEPRSLPDIRSIASAQNLELMSYTKSPNALAELRKQFKDGGFRTQERAITYAMKRGEDEEDWNDVRANWVKCRHKSAGPCSLATLLSSFLAYSFKTLFFDLTCRYGLSPFRPLALGLGLWFLCAIIYDGFIHGSGESALYRIEAKNIVAGEGKEDSYERIRPRRIGTSKGVRRMVAFVRREAEVLRKAMFFSAMSAFNIGFREINFGRWLRMLTRREYDMKAIGWARVVAGWQSLISVLLLALCLLTYFGRPFE